MTGRLEEVGRLAPHLGSRDGICWDGRADRYAANAKTADRDDDPLLRRLRRVTDRSSTIVDVGAGTGRYAIPLAQEVGHVTAVDPSKAMLEVLERDARQRGVSNVTVVNSNWQEADVPVADVAFSSFVLPLVADGPGFVLKLDSGARRHAFLYLGAYTGDAVLDPLWRHFHGAPRAPGASYLDALALLRELGIDPDVKVAERPNSKRFATVADAVEHYRDFLLLDDTPEVARELEGMLGSWLLGRRGAFRSPLRSLPVAIIHWRPSGAADG